MRIQIRAIGRMKSGPEQDLLNLHRKRLPFDLDVVEIDDRKFSSHAETRRQEEASALLGSLPAGAAVVALDERGHALTSRQFAQRLVDWRDDGRLPVVFVIGGADGLHRDVRETADLLLGFGSLTWPHMLVRGMLAEQIYRAHSIATGHPYHRD